MEFLVPYLNFVADCIALIGGVILCVGVVVGLYRLGLVEWASFKRKDVEHDRRVLRYHLGYYILLGLEFIVVADILRTIIHPGLNELIILGVVVLIRTVISVTLNWELSHADKISGTHP